MAKETRPLSAERILIEPWFVEAALARLDRRLSRLDSEPCPGHADTPQVRWPECGASARKKRPFPFAVITQGASAEKRGKLTLRHP